MTIEEQRAYLEQMLRKTPEGSARRTWAAAQLAALNAKHGSAITPAPAAGKSRRVK